MDNNYEKAVNNLETLYRSVENKCLPEDRAILEWSLLYLKDHEQYTEKVIRQ